LRRKIQWRIVTTTMSSATPDSIAETMKSVGIRAVDQRGRLPSARMNPVYPCVATASGTPITPNTFAIFVLSLKRK
jgi:hypothetical protein